MREPPKPGWRRSTGAGSPAKEGAGANAGAIQVEESPKQSQELKDLLEAIAAAERKGGYAESVRVFEERGQDIPASLSWRLHLELAECAKRSATIPVVRSHLSEALSAQPNLVQIWLEACRTMDELGEAAECRRLLEKGMECCKPNEQLMLKLVRALERLGDYAALRSLVGSLCNEPPEKICKVLLEAAHAEVRAGGGDGARSLLRSLMIRLPHQGPIFCEACRIECILGNWQAALDIAKRGVQNCVKHGPLWFSLVRYTDKVHGAKAVSECVAAALQKVCYELHWKFHFEAAASFSREGNIEASRQSIGAAALKCPKHLRWKVWLLASRSELWAGATDASRKLLARARLDAPARMQAYVCIEHARTEEYVETLDEARDALMAALSCEGHGWKVYLEHIFLEVRQGCLPAAKAAALSALELHPATGRLWSALISLEHSGLEGIEVAMATCQKAAREVPKSGEVWCETARIFMNPLGPYFNLDRAHKCLEFAVHLTPQYGDSFLELLRLRFLLELRARLRATPSAIGFRTGAATTAPVGSDEQGSGRQQYVLAALAAQQVCESVARELKESQFSFREAQEDNEAESTVEDSGAPHVRLTGLAVLCTYADPNYGFLWFWCRQTALSSPREVIVRMHEEVAGDLLNGGALWTYTWALARQVFGLTVSAESAACCDGMPADSKQKWTSEKASLAVLDFAVGSIQLSKCFARGTSMLDQAERQRLIFGSDILCV